MLSIFLCNVLFDRMLFGVEEEENRGGRGAGERRNNPIPLCVHSQHNFAALDDNNFCG